MPNQQIHKQITTYKQTSAHSQFLAKVPLTRTLNTLTMPAIKPLNHTLGTLTVLRKKSTDRHIHTHILSTILVPYISPSPSTSYVPAPIGFYLNPKGKILAQALIGSRQRSIYLSPIRAKHTHQLTINTTQPNMGPSARVTSLSIPTWLYDQKSIINRSSLNMSTSHRNIILHTIRNIPTCNNSTQTHVTLKDTNDI